MKKPNKNHSDKHTKNAKKNIAKKEDVYITPTHPSSIPPASSYPPLPPVSPTPYPHPYASLAPAHFQHLLHHFQQQ